MSERIKLDYIPAPTAVEGVTFGTIKRFLTAEEIVQQALRCPSCQSPTCQKGCPLGNNIGPFHNKIADGDLQGAADIRFNQTSVLAGIIGQVCPQDDSGLCEDTRNCVAGRGVGGESVMIGSIESSMAMLALENDWIKPIAKMDRVLEKDLSVGIIGSGPAALRAAEEAVRFGWRVVIYEREPVISGLWGIGIPNFHVNSNLLQGTIDLFKNCPNIEINTNCTVGVDISMDELASKHSLILNASGAQIPKTQPCIQEPEPGVLQAMSGYLRHQALRNWGILPQDDQTAHMHDKDVIIVGLGYTGLDCGNTALAQGANSVTFISLRLPRLGNTAEDLAENRKNGFNDAMLHEIQMAEEKGALFMYGVDIQSYEYNNNKAKLTILQNGKVGYLESDFVILARGFDIDHLVKPTDPKWQQNSAYNYKQGLISQINGIPILTIGDAALRPADRLVVKAAANGANTFRNYHFSLFPEDNPRSEFTERGFKRGRVIQTLPVL